MFFLTCFSYLLSVAPFRLSPHSRPVFCPLAYLFSLILFLLSFSSYPLSLVCFLLSLFACPHSSDLFFPTSPFRPVSPIEGWETEGSTFLVVQPTGFFTPHTRHIFVMNFSYTLILRTVYPAYPSYKYSYNIFSISNFLIKFEGSISMILRNILT